MLSRRDGGPKVLGSFRHHPKYRGFRFRLRAATALASRQKRRCEHERIDSLTLYTTEADQFWRCLEGAAERASASIHGAPPEVAVEVASDCRLYIAESAPTNPVPDEARRLGRELREVIVDRHNRVAAEAFLAEVVASIPGLVDPDDDGRLVSVDAYVSAVREGRRR